MSEPWPPFIIAYCRRVLRHHYVTGRVTEAELAFRLRLLDALA